MHIIFWKDCQWKCVCKLEFMSIFPWNHQVLRKIMPHFTQNYRKKTSVRKSLKSCQREQSAVCDMNCWHYSDKFLRVNRSRLWTPFWGYQTHTRGADKRAALSATNPYCHPFLPEPAKLIATDLVTHPVTCVIDIYIHMFTWLLFWGLGGICWINS